MDISSIVNATAPDTKSAKPSKESIADIALLDAIDSATLKRVQIVLREVCLESPEALNLARQKLLVENSDSPATEPKGLKRKHDSMQQRYEICVQCTNEYDIKDNPEDACRWYEGTTYSSHLIPTSRSDQAVPGETEVDDESDFWADHDEDCHGPIEDLRDVHPEGFIWNCCEKKGNEEGCEIGRHAPDLGKRVRRGA